MKNIKQKGMLFGFLAVATMASVMGTISGTLAWYAYATRATLSYSGTSVNSTVQLQIGLKSESLIPTADLEGLEVEDPIDFGVEGGPYYYFAPAGVGLSSGVISAYLKNAGYSYDSLAPITSGAYNDGETLQLKESPKDSHPYNEKSANHGYYSKIPFVFRVINSNNPSSESYEEDAYLWLTDAQVRASDLEGNANSEISKAIRLFIDRNDTIYDQEGYPDYIFNPSKQEDGYTTVGGILDLSGDDYYDFDDDGEILYGDYEGRGEDPDPALARRLPASGITDPDYDNINQTDVTDRRTTFTAKHHPNADYFPSYEGIVFKTAKYHGKESVFPSRLENGNFKLDDVSKSVCKTGGEAEHYLAEFTMGVYLEGWDHSVIDEEMEHYFDLGLTFEINRVS